jgi:hypothetical protein
MSEKTATLAQQRTGFSIWLVCAPFMVALALAIATNPPSVILSYAQETLLNVGLFLALLTPIVALALWRSPYRDLHLLRLAVALFTLSIAGVSLPEIGFVRELGLERNWQGKVLEIVWPVLFLLLWQRNAPAEFGFTTTLKADSLRPILIATGGLVACAALVGVLFPSPTTIEDVLYQLTMPGLAEEFTFRGILFTLLILIFGTP